MSHRQFSPLFPAFVRGPLFGLGCCVPLFAEAPKFTLRPLAENFQLGAGYVVVGDLDNDGTPDLAVSDPMYRSGSLLGSGIVYVISGADGEVFRTYEGVPGASRGFGASMAALDADGDGVPDLAVGAPGINSVTIFSGSDGSVISSTTGPAFSFFGSALANAGDQNADGLDDLYIGAPNYFSARGAVFVRSGSVGGAIREISGPTFLGSFGTAVVASGDLDGDGKSDLAISAPGVSSGSGRVSLYRSSDNTLATQMTGATPMNRIGDSMVQVPDVNGDGFPDLLAGSFSGGILLVLSGQDLSTLANLSIPAFPSSRAVHAGGGLDYDEDGVIDWLMGSPALNVESLTGGIRIVSGSDGTVLFERLTTVANSGLGIAPRVLPGYGFAAGERSLVDPDNGGRGLAHFWHLARVDTDGDGVPDDEDLVPESIMDPTVILWGENSGVENRVDASGTTLADRFAVLGQLPDYYRAAHFISQVHRVAEELVTAGLLTEKEARQLHLAAVRAAKKLRGSGEATGLRVK